MPTKGGLAGRRAFIGLSTGSGRGNRLLLGHLFLIALLTVGTLWVPQVGAALVASSHSTHRASSTETAPATTLEISSFTATPSSIFSGDIVYINLTAHGGTPPYSYWYRGLPPACPTVNNSTLICHPHDSEQYVLEGTLNDSAGNQVNATTNLTVKSGFGPPPLIQSFGANPSPGAVGKISFFVVGAVSESATPTSLLAYAFIGLPQGCATFNQSNLSCVPTAPGKYQVWVRVTDGFAQFSQTYLFFNVTGTVMTNNSGSPGVSTATFEIVVAGVAALVVVMVGVTYVLYWRKRPPPPSPAPEPPGPAQK